VNHVALFLITVAGIFLIGALGEIVFRRTQVPDVVWLIGAGIVIGPISHLVTREQLTAIAPYFAALTLVVVLFEGGSSLKLLDVSRSAPRSAALALITFLTAVGAVAVISMLAKLVGWLPLEWTFRHGLMLGAIVGGSSSIIIMPAMMQAKVEGEVANLVGLESAFTDAFCVVGASAIIDLLTKASGSGSPALVLLQSFGIGAGVGTVAGMFWLMVLRLLKDSEHSYPITLSSLLLLYVMIDHMQGSAALGILTFAVIVGNASLISGKVGLVGELDLGADVRGFHSQMAFIIKSFFFTFIGAMLGPPWSLIFLGILLGFVLLAARVPGVFLATLGSKLTAPQRKLVIVSLPRGMAAGVLATLPVAAGVVGTENLPPLVFSCVFTTILIFAVGFPIARKGAPVLANAAPMITAPIVPQEITQPLAVGGPGPPGPPPAPPAGGAGPPPG
jgi:Na+:H+ antiporter